jgi:hypothetical protein
MLDVGMSPLASVTHVGNGRYLHLLRINSCHVTRCIREVALFKAIRLRTMSAPRALVQQFQTLTEKGVLELFK